MAVNETQGAELEPKRFTKRSAFTTHDAHPIVLDVLLLDEFGLDWLVWNPETLWQEIARVFDVTISATGRNKVQALRTAHLVRSPWFAWETFQPVVKAFCGEVPDFRTLIRPTISQLLIGVDALNRVRKRTFGEDVSRYVAACCLDSEVCYLPPPLDFAQEYASQPRYRCRRCGNIDTDEENQVCDSCGAPQSELKKTLARDPESVRKKFEPVRHLSDDEREVLEETAVDIQVAKLLVATRRAAVAQAQLVAQLEAIKNER